MTPDPTDGDWPCVEVLVADPGGIQGTADELLRWLRPYAGDASYGGASKAVTELQAEASVYASVSSVPRERAFLPSVSSVFCVTRFLPRPW